MKQKGEGKKIPYIFMSIRPEKAHAQYRTLLQKDLKSLFLKTKGRIKKRACPLCSESKHKVYLKKGPYHTCTGCGLVYLAALPTDECINSYYQSSASASFFHEHVLLPSASLRKKEFFLERIEWMKTFGVSPHPRGLDLGSSIGTFVEVMKDHAWESFGLEPNGKALELGRNKGHQLFQNAEELSSALPKHSLDLVTAWEVLAHVPDLIPYLKTILSFLKPGGFLFLTTPNVASPEYWILKESHPNFVFPFLQLFAPDTIALLLDKLGFEIVSLETPGNMDLENIKTHLPLKRQAICPDYTRKILLSDEPWALTFRKDLQASLKAARLSGHMRVVAKKMK